MTMEIKNEKFQVLNNVREGHCPECAALHESYEPHNRDSLFYQFKFYQEHGRWPTWIDAMAHCSDEIKEFWIRELKALGAKIGGVSDE